MLQKLLRFSLMLFLTTAAAYLLHVLVATSLCPGKNISLINFSYKFNIGITFIFILGLTWANRKMKDQLGFIFLTGGIVKIGVFLYLINILEFELNKSNFLDFFVPYIACLAVEIFCTTKLLKNINANNNR